MRKKTKIEIPFHRPAIDRAELAAVKEVLRSGWLTMGPKTQAFEKAFARFVGAKHAIATTSCTTALHLALEAIGLRPDDEVLVSTMTFTASAEIVTYFCARPVLVDIDPQTLNLDPTDAARRITPRTRAIIPVHIAGQPCDMKQIHSLARQHGLHVIEDAAHALPAKYQSKRIGSLSEFTAFSFYATKPLTTGEGGMIITQNDELAKRMRLMRLHGISRNSWERYATDNAWYYKVLAAGYNYCMSDIQAAIGLAQLSKCSALWAKRCRIAQRYTEAFRSLEALEVPTVRPDRVSAWHLYILRLRAEQLRIDRDAMVEELLRRGIEANVHYVPLHLQPFYQKAFGYKPSDFPRAERESQRCLSLPIFPAMKEKEIARIIDAVSSIVHKFAK